MVVDGEKQTDILPSRDCNRKGASCRGSSDRACIFFYLLARYIGIVYIPPDTKTHTPLWKQPWTERLYGGQHKITERTRIREALSRISITIHDGSNPRAGLSTPFDQPRRGANIAANTDT